MDDVILLEPVESFIQQAYAAGRASAHSGEATEPTTIPWKGIKEATKSVTFLQGTLQSFGPSHPLATKLIGRVGHIPSDSADPDTAVDITWCQWCLGHLSDVDLIAFLKRCKAALRDESRSLIVVKENLCRDDEDGGPRTVFDDMDSSLTR